MTKIIPNGTVMRWKFNRNHDQYVTVRIVEPVPREPRQWQRYTVIAIDEDGPYKQYKGKQFTAQGNRLFEPVPKFNTLEEVEAWLETQ
jgi:hypothetical protein